MKKMIGLVLAISILLTATPVFAIRAIDFFSSRNTAATDVTLPNKTDVEEQQPAPDPDPEYDFTTPFKAYVEVRASDGTVNWLNDLDIASLQSGYPKLKLELFTYQGATKLYGMSALYVRGTLVGGDTFFASIWIPDQEVETMAFSYDDIWFNATVRPARAMIYNYNTMERNYQYLDTFRCQITGGTNVNCASFSYF